jgi:hypothetical protein
MTITIPLFPLNGVIFFPKSQLPLNIFEQRYLEMVDYSLSTNRLIGMIQSNNDKFYKIGCLGKINSFYETEDNRYIINLSGKKYFTINKELPKLKKFILAKVKLINEKKQIVKKNITKFDKDLLINKYKIYAENLNINIDFKLIKKIDQESLIKFMAMSCPFSTSEKQMLIETYDINELGNKIISLFDFYSNTKTNDTIN